MNTSDEQLIALARQGQLDAFNALVERYQGHVFNVALRMLWDRAQAEDVTQESFISAYRALGSFRGGSVKAWLLRIASNAALDAARSRRAKGSLSLDDMELSAGDEPVSKEEGPEEYAMRMELGRVVQGALAETSPDLRLAVVLVDVQGLSYEEAAQAMGTSVGTVKSRVSRGRASVREKLMKHRELLHGLPRLKG